MVRSTFERIESNASLNCFTGTTPERAFAEARAIDARRAAGESLPPLAGVPYAVKNLFDVRGLPTLAGARMRESAAPARRDAALVARMEAAGAILVGTTNMDEYAFGFLTENAHYGATHNPHDPTRIAGGSSGGSAAAVAAGIVPLALGSDTNGSIRVPASLCGTFGLKPTYGRLSRRGAFPFVASLDHVGPLAASLDDLIVCFDALQGFDCEDPVCVDRPSSAPHDMTEPTPLRVGRLIGYFDENAGEEAIHARDRALAAFDDVRDTEILGVDEARAAAVVVTAAEGANLHLPELRAQPSAFDPLVRDRLFAGALVPAAWLIQAQRVRRWFARRVAAALESLDVLVTAATPWSATLLGQREQALRGEPRNVQRSLGALTMPFSLIGLPALVIPVADGPLPLGVQLISSPWREDLLFRAAAAIVRQGVSRS